MEEEIYLYSNKVHSMNVLNGVLNESSLKFAKRTMLFDSVRNVTDLIKQKQSYPEYDICDVELTLDAVIMTRERYDKLIKAFNTINELGKPIEMKDHKDNEYLTFPKLKP